MANNKLLGRAIIRVNGKTFRQEKGATLDIGGIKRNTKMGNAGVNGFSEEPVPSKMEVSIHVGPETSLAEIRDWSNVVASFECDTGQTYVINGGWVTDPPVLEEGDGKTKFVIEGPAAEEMI